MKKEKVYKIQISWPPLWNPLHIAAMIPRATGVMLHSPYTPNTQPQSEQPSKCLQRQAFNGQKDHISMLTNEKLFLLLQHLNR